LHANVTPRLKLPQPTAERLGEGLGVAVRDGVGGEVSIGEGIGDWEGCDGEVRGEGKSDGEG